MKARLSQCLAAAPLLAAGLFAAAPAFADCLSDVQSYEPKVSAMSNAAAKDRAQGAISRAVEKAQAGDEAGCKRELAKARGGSAHKAAAKKPMKTDESGKSSPDGALGDKPTSSTSGKSSDH